MTTKVSLYVEYGPGEQELLYMTPLGAGHYRLEVTSIAGHLRYGDTIEVGSPSEDGSVPYRRIVKRSGLKTHCFILSKDLVESPEMSALAKRLQEAGGHCEGIAGGVFVAHVPRKSRINVEGEIRAIIRERAGNAAPDWKLHLKEAVMRLFGLR